LLIPWLITLFAGMATVVTFQSIVLSVGISMAVGVIFGLYPAVRAADSTRSRRCDTNERGWGAVLIASLPSE